MSKQKETTLTIISEILLTFFGIQKAEMENNLDTPLTQHPFNLDSISLTYFFLMLNDFMEIRLSSFEFDDYSFTTINRVLNLLVEE